MSKLFLATSFSGHVDYETNLVNPDYKKSIEDILSNLREIAGFVVFCAVEHEGWIISAEPPEDGVEKDLAEIDGSDALLAILPTGLISAGLQYEMGYADAKGKKVLAATETGTELAYFNQGVVNLGRIAHVTYESPQQLAKQVATSFGS